MAEFDLVCDFAPRGDQPKALAAGVREGRRLQTLLGVTGSGNTFAMANIVPAANRPTLVRAHNKTLAPQLHGEFRDYSPNAVEFFVSYYDYYQPEAYLPASAAKRGQKRGHVYYRSARARVA